MQRLYKPLIFVLVTFVGLGMLWPLAQGCFLGVIRGEGCKWQPVLAFVDIYYPWIVLFLLALGGITLLARQYYRRDQASGSFDLLKPASKLHPKDLGFRVVKPDGDAELEEHPALNLRPFYESTYVNRLAVLYEERAVAKPETYYDEDDLVDYLHKGKGFILIGRPEDGKTRTLYEIVGRMDGHVAVTLRADKRVPEKADILLLFKASKVILVLDDLSNLKNTESDLLDFQQRLTECEIPWVVASTCQDGSELTRARENFGKLYYDSRRLKLWLEEPTPQQKERLAESAWSQPWNPAKSDDYPTLDSIAMREAMAEMKRRFDILSDTHPEWADLLRALKLLDYAGVPCSHERLRAILGYEQLFLHSDHNLLKSLDALANQGFLHPGSTDPVEPERAYLHKVVKYVPGRKLEEDFDRLADFLEGREDSSGLLALGLTCVSDLEERERGITYLDRALRFRPNFYMALTLKGMALNDLGRLDEALEAYNAALKVKDFPEALNGRGVALSSLGRYEEALETYDAALKMKPENTMVLLNKGLLLVKLGRRVEAREAYNQAHRIFQSQADR